MKIVELRADNFRRLKAVCIRPDGAMVQICGANEQGKSSVLDSIWAALKGRVEGTTVPIRTGEEKAVIRLDLGEFIVLRTFRRSEDGEVTTTLKVTRMDGSAAGKNPQAVINAVIGGLSFDPLSFAKMEPKDQADTLKRMVVGFDFDANAKQRKQAYDERTAQNRIAKDAEAAARLVVVPDGPRPSVPDIGDALGDVQKAQSANAAIAGAQRRIDDKIAAAGRLDDEAETMRANALTKEREATRLKTEAQAAAEALAKPIDVTALVAKITQANALGETVRKFQERDRHEARASDAQKASEELTSTIDDLDRAKVAAIEQAAILPGLKLDDDGVTLDGLPLSQASDAVRLKTSVLVAMSLNPKLRVIRVHEGSTLDSKSLAMLARMAEEHDCQIWVERVDETGAVGFVIEDGEVVAEHHHGSDYGDPPRSRAVAIKQGGTP